MDRKQIVEGALNATPAAALGVQTRSWQVLEGEALAAQLLGSTSGARQGGNSCFLS